MTTPPEYDAEVIREFADELYNRAAGIVFMYSLYGFVIGGAAGFLAIYAAGGSALIVGLILGAVGAGIGKRIGDKKAFELRLKAQRALVQVKIEENTRA